ncbi:alpha/beta hydrolase fold domain-containing protein [Bacteroidota bacterium]
MKSNKISLVAVRLLILITILSCTTCSSNDDYAHYPAKDGFPQWNALGSRIAFSTNRDGSEEIYTISNTGQGLTRLTQDPYSDNFWPIWSPDGTRIIYSSIKFGNHEIGGNYEIGIVNADGSHMKNLTQHSAFDWLECWSPDGSKIIFSSDRDGNMELYIMEADGSDVKRLTNHPLYDADARWSPDGSKIVYMSDRGERNYDIYLMNPDGTGKIQLTDNPSADMSPNWMPDGTEIVFESRRDGKTQVYLMDADGSHERRLTDTAYMCGYAVPSPDGSRIAFQSNREGNSDIFVINRDGNSLKNLSSHPANDRQLTWSPDGKKIAFRSDRDIEGILSDIYQVNMDGTGLINLTDNDSIPQTEIRDIRYGPDEANILDLWLVNGPTPGPLVIFFHGGGFSTGDKRGSMISPLLVRLLMADISVASVNYRLTDVAPFPAQMQDCALALQFLRNKASQYGIDPRRIGAAGESAGALISMWLAFNDDLSDRENPDPILRESTRLTAIAPSNGPGTLDLNLMQEMFNTTSVHPALLKFFQIAGPEDFTKPEKIRLYEEASPLHYVTADDPPVFMYYEQPNLPLPAGCTGAQYVHHPRLGILLKDKLDSLGVECHLRLMEDTPDGKPFEEVVSFFLQKFRSQEAD